jgi:photosystem II stability/assembly factor-like uncharacterized protein
MPTNIDGLVVFVASLICKEKKVARIFAHQASRLSRRLLIGLLMICGMFPSLVQAEIWHSTATSGMRGVAVAPNGKIWLTGKNGSVWTADNVYGSSFTQIEASGFSRISVGPDGTVWAVKTNGTLWKFATGSWTETAASEIEDVAIAPDSKVWLAGKNGTIWVSGDQGKNFTQIEASGFNRISVGPDGVVWAVKSNGALWKFAAGNWSKTAASRIGDVAIETKGLIWLADKDGAIWRSPDDGVTFSQDEEASGIESVAAGRGGAWAVGFDGTLWRKLFSPQF